MGVSWTEQWRIDAFELCCWRRLLRVLWTARRSNESILKEINPEYLLEGLILKVQYFDHLMWSLIRWEKPWCWERLKAGGEGDNREWDGWMASPTLWIWVWAGSGSWWWTGRPGMHGVARRWTWLEQLHWLNWTCDSVLLRCLEVESMARWCE